MDNEVKKVLVLGLGKSGQAALRLAVAKGMRAIGVDEQAPPLPQEICSVIDYRICHTTFVLLVMACSLL